MDLTDTNLEHYVIDALQSTHTNMDDAIELLQRILDINLSDTALQSTVDECFTAIRTLAGIPVSLMHLGAPDDNNWKEYAIRFFTKAINVMDSDLQTSVDYDERHLETYTLDENFSHDSEANRAYAKSIIKNELKQCFNVVKNSDQRLLTIYKAVETPVFNKIKKVIIDDEPYEYLNEGQAYINQNILEIIEYGEAISFNIQLVLQDDRDIFNDLTIDLNNMYDVDFIHRSFLEEAVEYLGYLSRDELNDIVNDSYNYLEYEIDLSAYKNENLNTLELDFLYEDIFDDIYSLPSRYGYHFRNSVQKMEPEEQINFLSEILSKLYKSDIDKLEYERRIIELLIARKEVVKRIPLIQTYKLENTLPEFPLEDESVFVGYLQLKNILLNSFQFKNFANKLISNKGVPNIFYEDKPVQHEPKNLGRFFDLINEQKRSENCQI